MKKLLGPLAALLSALLTGCGPQPQTPAKQKLMWLDCSANWERFSNPDSIRYYAAKCRETGMTGLVLDMKGTSGAVIYPSRTAPQLREWKGTERPADFDCAAAFIEAARDNGLAIYGSFNTFAEGHGLFHRGVIYDHPEWQSINYLPGRGLTPQLEIPGKSVLFTNPALPEVQQHEIDILREAAERYDLDGILLDRARYDNIQSDFSGFSRAAFEAYIGEPLTRYPEEIYTWAEDGRGGWQRIEGPRFRQWIEWRASVIHGFFARVKRELAEVNPRLRLGAYTGAWYPSYFEVGVNWASSDYDPSEEFDWATPEYRKYGYADLLDLYTNGNYYWPVTIEEYRQGEQSHLNETDSRASHGDHLSVEGGCRYSRRLLAGRPFLGGLYVESYRHDSEQFRRAVEMNLRESDGLMIFDIVHIIERNWWEPLRQAIAAYESQNQ